MIKKEAKTLIEEITEISVNIKKLEAGLEMFDYNTRTHQRMLVSISKLIAKKVLLTERLNQLTAIV